MKRHCKKTCNICDSPGSTSDFPFAMQTTSESDSSSSEYPEESIDNEEGSTDDNSGSEESESKDSSKYPNFHLGGESEKPPIAEQYAGSKEMELINILNTNNLKRGNSRRRIEEALKVCVPAGFMIDKRIVSRVVGDKEEERESNCFPKKMNQISADAERCTKEGHFEYIKKYLEPFHPCYCTHDNKIELLRKPEGFRYGYPPGKVIPKDPQPWKGCDDDPRGGSNTGIVQPGTGGYNKDLTMEGQNHYSQVADFKYPKWVSQHYNIARKPESTLAQFNLFVDTSQGVGDCLNWASIVRHNPRALRIGRPRRVVTSWCLPLKKPSECQEDRYEFLRQRFEKNGWSNKFCHVKLHTTTAEGVLPLAGDDDCSRFASQVCVQVTACGSDGATYPTLCALEEANCKAMKKGLAPIKWVDNRVCGSKGVKDNDCSRFTSRICAQVLVCGSDGVSYPTPCAKSRKTLKF